MTRVALAVGVVAAVVAAVQGAVAMPAPARALVSADEFTLTLSRPSIRRGPAIIQLVNGGEDDHDLALRRAGGSRTYRIGIVHPGAIGELDAPLRPGLFTLWCTLADHRGRGMRATLRVV
jgi:hypothetical protein